MLYLGFINLNRTVIYEVGFNVLSLVRDEFNNKHLFLALLIGEILMRHGNLLHKSVIFRTPHHHTYQYFASRILPTDSTKINRPGHNIRDVDKMHQQAQTSTNKHHDGACWCQLVPSNDKMHHLFSHFRKRWCLLVHNVTFGQNAPTSTT